MMIDKAHIESDTRSFPWVIALAVLCLIAAGLRLIDLGAKSVWFDEVHTFNDAMLSFDWGRRSHVLYYWIVSQSLKIGDGEFWLRLPSAIFGVLGVPMIYLAGRECFKDRFVGLLAALFICFSITHIQFSQEARYYPVMFFWSAAGLFFLARYLNRGCLQSGIALPVTCVMNYFIHPVTLVGSGFLMMWALVVLFSSRWGRDLMVELFRYFYISKEKSEKRKNPPRLNEKQGKDTNKSGSRRRSRKNRLEGFFSTRWGRALVFLCLFACLIVGSFCFWKFSGLIFARLRHVKWFSNPAPHVEATWKFFINGHFVPYGPGDTPWAYPARVFGVLLCVIYAIIMFVGYVRVVVIRPVLGSLFWTMTIVSFVLLFSIGGTVIHHYKYLMFLYPGHVLCLMSGLRSLTDWAGRFWSKFGFRAVLASGLILAVFFIPNFIKDGLALNRYYRGERIDVKSPMSKIVAASDGDRDFVAGYGLTTMPMEYYADLLGIPESQRLFTSYEKGDGTLTISRMIKAAGEGGDLWFIQGWQWDSRKGLTDWIRKHFTIDEVYPSLKGGESSVELWKWKYADRVLSPSSSVTVNVEEFVATAEEETSSGVVELYVTADMDVEFEVSVLNDSAETSGFISILMTQLEGAKSSYSLLDVTEIRDESTTFISPVRAGASIMHVMYRGNGSPPGMNIIAVPRENQPIVYPATAFNWINPQSEYVASMDDGRPILKLRYNNSIRYEVSVEEGGIYEFGLSALNDEPGPVIFQIDVNGVASGLITYFKKNDEWETKSICVGLNEGSNLIEISYVSDNFPASNDGEDVNDTDASLSHFSLRQAVKCPNDDVPMDRLPLVQISQNKIWPPQKASDGSLLWNHKGYSNVRVEKIKVNDEDKVALAADLHSEIELAGCLSQLFPVKPGEIYYYSVKVRCEQMLNHSVNAQLFFFYKDRKIYGEKWGSGQGVTDDADGVKFVNFGTIPHEVAYAAVYFGAYRNSTNIYDSTGRVWFYDFKSDLEIQAEMGRANARVKEGL